jgi:hypothetical protein
VRAAVTGVYYAFADAAYFAGAGGPQTMHSRQHGGKGVDPRGLAGPAAVVSAEELFAGTLLPFFQGLLEGRAAEDLAAALPHADAFDATLPESTCFVFDEEESARNMVAQILQDCPALAATRDGFLARMAAIYDRLAA